MNNAEMWAMNNAEMREMDDMAEINHGYKIRVAKYQKRITELEAERDELRAVEEDRFKENTELRAQLEAVRAVTEKHIKEMNHRWYEGDPMRVHGYGGDVQKDEIHPWVKDLRDAILQPDSGKDGG